MAVPAGVVTEMLPVDCPGTTAEILVGELTLNDNAATPPKLTAVVPLKLVPVMVTVLPTAAVTGANELIAGGVGGGGGGGGAGVLLASSLVHENIMEAGMMSK